LKSLGATCYRFSVSWSRVIPLGGRDDPVNEAGLKHYVRLCDALLAAGIQPVVTLYHWDLPAALDDRYGGFLGGHEFVQDFVRYARVMFDALGSRIKWWITFNEPWCTATLGYSTGLHAPGRTSDRSKNPVGDGTTEPWIAGHNILLAHAYAVKAFRQDFKAKNGGEIAITLNGKADSTFFFDSACFKIALSSVRDTLLTCCMQATGSSHGIRKTLKTLQLVHASWNSSLDGLQTPFIMDGIPTA
jgi:beta-glucosidase